MSLPQKKGYTVADIYNLPDGERAELIDGQIYDMTPPPMRVHQKIVIELSVIISNYIKENGGSCEVYPAPFAVFLNRDDKTYVEPDISVICDKDKLSDRGCEGAPDWIIEVVSPSSKRMDCFIKLFKYRSAGVREYWIVNPDERKILVYGFENEDYMEYTFSDSVKSGIYDDLEIDFSQLNL